MPHACRVASAVFRRPYSGPQGRRQALLSFVSENGATCFAVPPGVPVGGDSDAGNASAGRAPEQQGGGLVIPRRLQHKEGQWRRRNQQPGFPSPQVGGWVCGWVVGALGWQEQVQYSEHSMHPASKQSCRMLLPNLQPAASAGPCSAAVAQLFAYCRLQLSCYNHEPLLLPHLLHFFFLF